MKKTIIKRLLSCVLAVLVCSSAFPLTNAAEDAALEESRKVYTPTVTQNQKNMVARADYYYGITWVAQEDTDGWSGYFYKGGTYRIPYGQPIDSGKYIGYAATFDEFLEAAGRAGSIFYTGRSWYSETVTTAPYYVSDCSAFVSWCWGIQRTTTYYIPGVTTKIGNVTVYNATHNLQLGDALNSNPHVVMVTGLEYDASGNITTIEITEQTPPQMKRSYHTPTSLYNKYYNYTIQRYYGDVPVAPDQHEETWIEKACFDTMVYRDRNADIAHLSDAELKEHWLSNGIKEGRAASPVLDLGFYANNNPDVKEACTKDGVVDYEAVYNHFINNGYKEKRKSSALFDGAYYCSRYPDVASSYKDEYLRHYVENGIYEGRRASLTFDPDYYWFIRPDVAEAWPGDYQMCAKHYAGHGIVEQIEAYDHEYPVISNAVISDVSADGYTVTCTVTDNWGLSRVSFPTWTVLNDQDDLADDFMNTQQGTQNGSTYTFRVNAADHNNEGGAYVTHIYARDKGGNQVSLALSTVEVKDTLDQITLTAASSYTRSAGKLYDVQPGTTVDTFLAQFENEVLEVVNAGGSVITGASYVGTGTVINLYKNGAVVDTVTVVVLGDLDGNGLVNTSDYATLRSAFMGKVTLTDVQKKAADVDGNGAVNSTDYVRIKAHTLEKFNLYK